MRNAKTKLDRREFLAAIGGGATLLSFADHAAPQSRSAQEIDEFSIYVGTYTSGTSKSQGIYYYRFNKKTGELTPKNYILGVVDPSFLVVEKNRKFLYSVNETLEYEGKKSGAVSSFAIDQKTGELTLLNKQPSLGGAPCHLSLSTNGRFLLVANYVGGNIAVLPIGPDGRLGEAVNSKTHTGSGPNKDRQESAHAHSITLDRNDRFAVACDLGADKVFIYKFNKRTGKLTPNSSQAFFSARPGAGPRHFAFHSNGRNAFVINELHSSVTSLAYDERRGVLNEIHTTSTLPHNWVGENTCADIHISPNGRFVYGSNRGHDSIVCFSLDDPTGKLSLVAHTPTGGRTPRNFAIDPTGNFLLAANQNSDSICTFQIDPRSGRLTQIGNSISIPSPVCVRFL